MSAKATWLWVIVATGLFGLILLHQHYLHKPSPGPIRILPALKSGEVTALQVRPPGTNQLQIRAERTNGTWQLVVESLVCPARPGSVENLLTRLEQLTPAYSIAPSETRSRTNADLEYGFLNPQCSIQISQGDYRPLVLLGVNTAPGDQVYLQVVGREGAYIVDHGLLDLIPRSVNDWRDTTVVNLDTLAFDWLAVTNNTKAFIVERTAADQLWHMVWPLKPARADNIRLKHALQKLQALRVEQFISDDPKPALGDFGLATPETELALGLGTNTILDLQFGKSPTNNPTQVYARCVGQNTIFTVAKELVEPWRVGSINDFRSPHVLTLPDFDSVNAVEVRAQDTFSLQRQTNGTWSVAPQDFAADTNLVSALLFALTQLRVVEFAKDNVTDLGLAEWGLAPPFRQYRLKAACGNSALPATNQVLAEINFGITTNQPGQVFARRSDESFVYRINTNDFGRLPTASWQLRERRIWHFSPEEVAEATIRQNGKVRRLTRRGLDQWSPASGSPGLVIERAVEEVIRGLSQVEAAAWVASGDESRARYGISDKGFQLTIDLKNQAKATIEFGGRAPSSNVYAAVLLEGQLRIFEFPSALYQDIRTYLSIPPSL